MVLAGLMGVVLSWVRDPWVAAITVKTAEGFITAQLSRCLSVKVKSFLLGMNLRTGDSWGLWVMRTQTRGGGSAVGLGCVVLVKLSAGGFFCR